jgi:hypothetical protein
LKYWYSHNQSPNDSFELEKTIADMNFNGDNIESGFYYAIDKLPTFWSSVFTKAKESSLVNNKKWGIEI